MTLQICALLKNKIYSKKMLRYFPRHVKKYPRVLFDHTYKNMVGVFDVQVRPWQGDSSEDNQCRLSSRDTELWQRSEVGGRYVWAEERRTWNRFRVIRMDPSSRFSLSRRFSKAT